MSLMEPITCPCCGTTGFNFYIYHNGVTIYPELGKEVRGCYACRGLFGVGDVAANGNSVKEEERMNQLFCETTEELFCEITENLELTQKNKELFRIFLHSLDTEEMRIFILNRLFVRRIAQNGEVRE